MPSFIHKPIILVALATIASIPSIAGTISLVSNTSLTNNGSGTTYAITPDPVWAGPLVAPDGTTSTWVSDVPTTVKDSSAGSTVIFTDTFTLTGDPSLYFGSITVLADDSTSVYMNGHQLEAVNPNQGTNCANAPIGCLTSTELTITLPSADLLSGTNNLSFGVRQGVSDTPFGLDFAGDISNTPDPDSRVANAPEPGSLGAFGLGLIVLSGGVARIRNRRRR
jgi:PEP-CTERM motif